MFKIIGADGREYGPVDAAQIRAWLKEGRVDARTVALADGGTEWKPLNTFPEFSAAIPSTPPPTLSGPPGVYPQTLRTNGFAMAGLILGILSLPTSLCFCCYGFPFNILAFIFSMIALSQIKQSPHIYTGRGIAITGLVLSLVSFALAIFFMLFGAVIDWTRFNSIPRDLNLH